MGKEYYINPGYGCDPGERRLRWVLTFQPKNLNFKSLFCTEITKHVITLSGEKIVFIKNEKGENRVLITITGKRVKEIKWIR